MKCASDTTRVPFGRTDVLIGANDAPSPELSYGHGLKGTSFRGLFESWVFSLFSQQNENVQLETTRVGYYHFEFVSRSTRWAWFSGHTGAQ